MIKKCTTCGTVASGSEEEVTEVFRKMKDCIRNVCKKCEYQKFKKDYWPKARLRGAFTREDAMGDVG